MSRKAFTRDACFGMPGVPAGPGSCEIHGEGTALEIFAVVQTEYAYKIWLRGYNAKALAVRDELKGLQGTLTVNELGKWWQDSGFIPKRPGD